MWGAEWKWQGSFVHQLDRAFAAEWGTGSHGRDSAIARQRGARRESLVDDFHRRISLRWYREVGHRPGRGIDHDELAVRTGSIECAPEIPQFLDPETRAAN